MRRIRRTEAVCLRSAELRESSKLVTFFSEEDGRLVCSARGARRPKSRFGAALDRFAVSRIIYYWHQERTVYTLTDVELVRSHPGLAAVPDRFLAAEQVTEFVLRTVRAHDPNPQLYRLVRTYLAALETAEDRFPALVGSFLLKAASFLGFRPQLRACLECGRAVRGAGEALSFDPVRGGVFCPRCAEPGVGTRIEPGELAVLDRLLHTPGADIAGDPPAEFRLGPVLRFVSSHIDPLLLNSFNWQTLQQEERRG
jgi:DNA repair protein RecO (recombination protein O)